MSRFPKPYSSPYEQDKTIPYATDRSVVANFMNLVYAWMCVGLATTAVIAWWISTQPQIMQTIFTPGTLIVLLLAQLGLVIAISRAVEKISAPVATGLFILYAALNGLTLSGIFITYEIGTIFAAFGITAGMFGAMSVVGFVTKKDLSSMGGFLFMALIGLIIASIVNYFVASSPLGWAINYAFVLVFLGLTVYDTNRLKQIAYETQGNESQAARAAIVGSLVLYLDFINLFIMILRIMGRRE